MVKVGEMTGTVLAVSPDGSTRVLSEGDVLKPEETVQTQSGSSAVLQAADGRTITVPANMAFSLSGGSVAIPATDFVESPQAINESQTEQTEMEDGAPRKNDAVSRESESPDGGEMLFAHSFQTTPEIVSSDLESALDLSALPDSESRAGESFLSQRGTESAYTGKGVNPITNPAPAVQEVVPNSPITVPQAEPEPQVMIGGTQITTVIAEPEPVHEAASAARDSVQIVFGETLSQQSGVLINDSGTGISLNTVNGTAVTDLGPTTIQGNYGTLTIQTDGSYSYQAEEVDIESGLVAYWGFNQPTSDKVAEDQSGVDQVTDNGMLHGQAAIVENGFSGNALSLDGRGDHVSVNNIHHSVEDYTPVSNQVVNNNFNDGTTQGWDVSGGFGADPTEGGFLYGWHTATLKRQVDTSDETAESYTLTFTLAQGKSNSSDAQVYLDWGGERVATFTAPRGVGLHTTQQTITLPATGDPTTELKLTEDQRFFRIDDVIITKNIPEDVLFNDTVEVAHTYVDPLESSGGNVEERTISFAFKPGADNDLTDRQVLYTEGGGSGGFIVYIQNNTLYAGAHDGANWNGEYLSTDISSLDASQWQNVALTLDGSAGTLEAFLNGESFGLSTNAQSLDDAIGGVALGSAGSVNKYHDGVQSGSFNFDGMIDEVRVYDRVLSNVELNTLANGSEMPVDTFDYQIEDAEGGTSDSTLDVYLNTAENQAPIAVDDSLSVMSDQSFSVNSSVNLGLLGNDADSDGDVLRVTHVGDKEVDQFGTVNIAGDFGTLTIASDGTYAYSPLFTAVSGGIDTFSYTVSDGTTTSTATLTVSVIADSFANADSATVVESALPAGSLYVLDDVNDGGMHLSVVNAETGITHKLGELSPSMLAIAMSPSGVLYGANNTHIYTIDPATQSATVVGSYDLPSSSLNITGLTFAPDGSLFASEYDGNIYRADTTTGALTSIGNVSSAEQVGLFGDMVWHDGALYTQGYAESPARYTFLRIDVDGNSTSMSVLPSASDIGSLHSLASVDGELIGIDWGANVPAMMTIDSETGLIEELRPSIGTFDPENATSIEQLVEGNVLSNDTGAVSVTTVSLPDGTSRSVDGAGVTLQGSYGTLTLRSDGTYIYNINNNLEATNNLVAGETGNDRFIYTATGSDGDISQSILTVYVNGSNEVQVTDNAIFSDYSAVDRVDTSSDMMPIDFVVSTQNDTDRITEIRIAHPYGTEFNIPPEWTDHGTVTTSGHELVWTATPGNRAGLESVDAIADGLTLSSFNGGEINISVITSEYDVWGNVSSNWTTASSISMNLVTIENEQTGSTGTDILSGTAENDAIIGGAGFDVMTGGESQDFFIWQSGHEGVENNPTVDTITDFSTGRAGDVLDLRDLLPDNASESLDQFLSFSFESGDTTIGISTTAGGPVVQNIVLDGVDLSATFGTTDVTLLTSQLTDNGNLLS
ncbi:Ig-like domain-containing protein [Sansalvadorimonas verongulae]|uniref:Ig-like domain-containing protein n=1 Tax=Sansalvadorimonas verongulae TaxID=2172824 RepID=UPI0012BD3642|nr:VCBS domain-containing protein [Sansalvadorimonas verongulae]MTI15314.1 type I secretion C-terminal target domain-containing protein [Sansalvadorimonas verongulae]